PPAIEIAVGAMGSVDLGGDPARELRGSRVDSVAANGRVEPAAGRLLRGAWIVAAAHVRLHRVAAARQGERDVARRGLLPREQLMGRLEKSVVGTAPRAGSRTSTW